MCAWQRGGRSLFCVVSLIVCGAGVAKAASGTWLGTVNDQWTESLNWSASPYPGNADIATFDNAGNGKTTIQQKAGNQSFVAIYFKTANCAAYTIGGTSLNAQRLNFTKNGRIQIFPEVVNDQTFNNYLQMGADWDAATYKFINDSPSAKLILAGELRIYFSGWGRPPKTKQFDFEGVGDIRALGNVQTNGGSPILIFHKGSGLLTLSGANRINQLNLSNLKSSEPSRFTIGSGSLFLDNGTNSWSLMSYSDGVIDGTGTIRLGTGTDGNFAKCYVSPNKTLIVNPKIISDGGLDLNFSSGTLVLNGINDLASEIVISAGGTISVAKIGNRGSSNSNLGQGQRVRFDGSGSRLLYTGTGETSDRILEINNNARLDNSGTGNLVFSEDPVVGDKAKTLTLQGDTEGIGELTGALGPGTDTTSLAKQGTGVWCLSAANSYEGTTTVSGGTLVFKGAAGAATASSGFIVSEGGTLKLENTVDANHANRLNDAASVTMNGGTLSFSHNGGATDFTETNGALIISGGTNTVTVSQASESQTSTLTFTSITRTGGAVDFTGAGLGESDRNRIFITGQADGLIGRWATFNGTTLAAYSSTLGVHAAGDADFTDIAAQGPGSVIPDDSAASARINSAGVTGPITLAGEWDNSIGLLMQNTGTNAIVAMRDGETNKTLLTDWVQIAQNKASLILGESADDGILMPLNQGGELTLENQSTNATLTVNAVVTNNVSASSLFKTGAGNVTLAGAARYTGATLIDEGTLTFASAATQVLPGTVSGAGALSKKGTGVLTLSGDNTSHTGETLVNEGILVVEHNNALGPTDGAGTVIADGATLDLGGSLAADKLNLASGTITVSGSGVENKGAMTCASANPQAAALRGTKVSLAADAAFGGNSRWDIWPTTLSPHLDLNGHTFNKIGNNTIYIINIDTDPGAGHIVVKAGSLGLVYNTLLNGSAANTLTVEANARLDLFSLKYPQEWTLELQDLAGLGVVLFKDPYNTWSGLINLHGTVFLTGASGRSLSLKGQISGVGSLIHADALTTYLTHTNNIYTGATIVSNGTLHVAHAGSLPGYATAGKVAVRTPGTLTVMTGDGVTGWNKAQLDTLRSTTTFATKAALGLDTSFGDFVYNTDFSQTGITLAKYGTNTLTFAGVNTLEAVQVRDGALSLSNTSANAFGSLLVTGGATEPTTVNIDGPTEIVNAGNISHAAFTGDRCVMNIASDLALPENSTTFGIIEIGSGANRAGAVYQRAGAVTVGSTGTGSSFLTVGNAGGYGYYRMTGGSLTTGEMAIAGPGISTGGSDGVFDLFDGELTVNGWCLLLSWAKGTSALNLFGGSFGLDGRGREVIFAYSSNIDTTSQLNLLGPEAKMFDRGTPTSKLITLARGDGNTLCALNLNNGELTVYRVQVSTTDTPSHFNFNGGLLRAAANNTTLMQGLTAAHVFPGGARIDTDGHNVTINQSLVAPTGYGASKITLTSGGAGYIGAPTVEITGGSGVGATAIALVDLEAGSPACGQVTNILVTSAGSGYDAADTLVATLRGGGFLSAAKAGSVTKSVNANGGLTKIGEGILTLGGANNYAGATVISNGTLKLANEQALPTGTALRLEGGTLDLNGFTVTNTISGSGGTVATGTLHSDFSPAGTNVVGTQGLALDDGASVSGAYFLDVTAEGDCDMLTFQGDVDLSNVALKIVDQSQLNRGKRYAVASVSGTLGGLFDLTNMDDDRWQLSASADGVIQLFFSDGLILILR